MADWPEQDELAQVLNVENVEDWETTLDRVLASAIAQVKLDVGNWDEDDDEPSDSQAQAALRLAELLSARAGVDASALTSDPTYQRLLVGSRRAFGIA